MLFMKPIKAIFNQGLCKVFFATSEFNSGLTTCTYSTLISWRYENVCHGGYNSTTSFDLEYVLLYIVMESCTYPLRWAIALFSRFLCKTISQNGIAWKKTMQIVRYSIAV